MQEKQNLKFKMFDYIGKVIIQYTNFWLQIIIFVITVSLKHIKQVKTTILTNLFLTMSSIKCCGAPCQSQLKLSFIF